MSNDMTIMKSEAQKAFQTVLMVGKEAANQLAEARALMDPVAESMAMAFGIASLQDAIRENPQAVAVLQRMGGHKWGFKTDRDDYNGGGTMYKPDVIIPCFCEALMNQLRPIGNEFNIITSSTYTTKEGWAGLLSRLPGVTEVDSRPGAIVDYDARDFQTKKGDTKKKITASVSATADCNVWGQFVQVRAWKTGDVDERLQLSVIADEIDEALDQLKGKADARILERLHQKVVALSHAGPQGVPQVVPQKRIDAKPADKPKQITEQKPATEQPPVDGAMTMATWDHDWKVEAKKVGHTDGDPHAVILLARRMRAATTVEELEAALNEAKAKCGKEKNEISTRLVQKLQHYAEFRVEQIGVPEA
jgi:hypothetical protein